LGLIFGTGNGTGFKTSSGVGTKTEPRPSSKIGTKELVLSLDQRFLKIIQPVLALSQGFEKSKNWVKAPTINQMLFRFFHKNCRFFENLKKSQNWRFF
jgi:hypothetical protein